MGLLTLNKGMNPVNSGKRQIKPIRCKSVRIGAWLMWAACLLAVAVPVMSQDEDFRRVDGPCNLRFPDDHGPHPGYRTEWWYYTGNLADDAGRRFGFQLTLFRHQISPPGAERKWPRPASRWRTRQLYLGHAAITDIQAEQHLFAEEIAREALSLSGTRREGDRVELFLKNWQIAITPQNQHLQASTEAFSLDLTLVPEKDLVLHGEEGYSRKGSQADMASCYYSFTRLAARGAIGLDESQFAVSGLAWMDHEFSTAPLEPGLEGWDWFSLQLEDRTELMVFTLRRAAGGLHPASSGTFVLADGTARAIGKDAFDLKAQAHWKSPSSGAEYPVRWRLTIPELQINLVIEAGLVDQEMRTTQSTGVTYWEGSVSVRGTSRGQPVAGVGYVELTGYAEPFDRPL